LDFLIRLNENICQRISLLVRQTGAYLRVIQNCLNFILSAFRFINGYVDITANLAPRSNYRSRCRCYCLLVRQDLPGISEP